MGLVLYSSTDGDPLPSSREPLLLDGRDARPEFLSSFFGSGGGGPAESTDHYLADLVAHHRHLPPSGTQRHDWRCGPSKARLNARRHAAWASRYEYEYYDQIDHMREASEVDLLRHNAGGLWPRRLRPHQIRLLQRSTAASYSKRWYECERYYNCSSRHGGTTPHVRGQRQSVRDACLNEMAVYQPRAPCSERSRPAPPVTTPAWTRSARRAAEDVDRSDRSNRSNRSDRPPSLERQGAFRDATTTKRRLSEASLDLDPDEAELYRLGLLYDNEHACGAGFGLDAIVHDAPLYTISASRPRGRERGRSPRSETDDLYDDDLTLPQLGLSFANLADDAALARFLQDEEMAAYLAAVPAAEAEAEAEDEAAVQVPDLSFSPASSSSSSSSQPVRVIYELAPEMEMEMEAEPAIETDSSHGTEAGDWVMDMDLVGERTDPADDHDHDHDNDSLLFRTADDDTADADADHDSNPDDAWLLLRP